MCHTIEYIKRKPYGNNLLTKVKDEVKLVIEATQDYETSEDARDATETDQGVGVDLYTTSSMTKQVSANKMVRR